MKAHTLAAVLFRIGGVTLLVRSVYYFACYLNTHIAVPIHGAATDIGYMSMFAQAFITGGVIYIAAPLLAKMAVWKIRD